MLTYEVSEVADVREVSLVSISRGGILAGKRFITWPTMNEGHLRGRPFGGRVERFFNGIIH